ncbi:phosphatase domain-containing putative toxin [Azospirillum doebereinerae]
MSCGNGRIGISACPGKKQPRPDGGIPYERDTTADVAAIARWGAGVLLSLMESTELRRYGAADVGARAQAAGILWHHLPIVDHGRPDQRFEAGWAVIGPMLRNGLANGGSVAIHCLAGLGRSGTVACRLLIETGMEPEAAIRHLRAQRPGAVNTAVQEPYLKERAWLRP